MIIVALKNPMDGILLQQISCIMCFTIINLFITIFLTFKNFIYAYNAF